MFVILKYIPGIAVNPISSILLLYTYKKNRRLFLFLILFVGYILLCHVLLKTMSFSHKNHYKKIKAAPTTYHFLSVCDALPGQLRLHVLTLSHNLKIQHKTSGHDKLYLNLNMAWEMKSYQIV